MTGVPIYADADIRLERVNAKDTNPIALYVLRPNLRFLQDVLAHVDIFNLTDTYQEDGLTIAPPIIEIWDGKRQIVDGIHRMYLALVLDLPTNIVTIEGVNPAYPLVSEPVNWSDVREYDNAPETKAERRRLRPGISATDLSYSSFFRDYSTLGSQGRRMMAGEVA